MHRLSVINMKCLFRATRVAVKPERRFYLFFRKTGSRKAKNTINTPPRINGKV